MVPLQISEKQGARLKMTAKTKFKLARQDKANTSATLEELKKSVKHASVTVNKFQIFCTLYKVFMGMWQE